MSNEKQTNTQETDELEDLIDVIEDVDDESISEDDVLETEESDDLETEDSEDEDTSDNESSDNEEEEEAEDDSVVSSVKSALGYDGDEEFEDSEEGIAQLTRKAAEKMAREYIDNELDPNVKDFEQYVKMGGDPQKYLQTKFPSNDYSTVEFDAENEDLQERIVRDELVARGYNGEEIEEEIKDYKNGGILESKAKRALVVLKNKQEEEKSTLLERQREAKEQETEEIQKAWNEVKDTIFKTSEFKGLKVPESDKSKFFDYMSKPVEEGKSQRDKDVEEADMETRLAIDYLLYKGFKLNDLVERKAKDLKAKSLKEKLQKAKLNKKTNSQTTSQNTGGDDLIDI